LNKPLG